MSALRRNPQALAAGEWWRMITPLFVDPDGWLAIAAVFVGIALVGPDVERRLGWARWLALYFGAGLVGEVAGYAWLPYDAGASIALSGLIGALLLQFLRKDKEVHPLVVIYVACVLASWAVIGLVGWVPAVVFTGIVGGLTGMLFARNRFTPGIARLYGLGGIVAALALIAQRNLHGPPLLAGVLLALLMHSGAA
jgi:membrane associated rhomboid family serine protease